MSTQIGVGLSEAIDLAKQGQRLVIQCPAHDDSSPSLAVAPGNSQPVLLTCHAGCEREAILAAAGIEWADVCNDDALDALATGVDNWTPAGKASHIYPYLDEQGTKLFEVLRTPTDGGGKTFFQRKIDPKEPRGFVWKMDNVRRVPYRLPHLLLAINEGQRCHIVEGEKCVHALLRRVPEGEAVTTNPGGAGKWQEEWGQWFAGATVDIYADGDDTGRQHARAVRESIVKHGGRARILEAPTHHDVADHLAAGLSLDDLLETTPESMAEKARTGVDILEMLKRKIMPTEWAIHGTLAKGERLLVVGLEGHGKALALDTAVPTPYGWTTMEKLSVGDEVFAHDGSVTTVIAETEVMHDRPCYRVVFDDGTEVVADEQHLWLTETRRARETAAVQAKRERTGFHDQRHKIAHQESVVTTGEILATLKHRSGSTNHSVRTAGPLALPDQPLLISPYTLGAWLGDGHSADSRITTHTDDVEILDAIRVEGWTVTKQAGQYLWNIRGVRKYADSFVGFLRSEGVLNNKHIPEQYLRASYSQRLALLQGLMDTDGTIYKDGRMEFCVTSERLALGALELLRTFGIKTSLNINAATLNGRIVGKRYRLAFQTEVPVFRLTRKAERMKPSTTQRAHHRFIVAVEPVRSVPVKCIQVEHEAGTYLVTDQMIPTHNSTLLRQIAVCVAAGIHPFNGRDIEPKRVLMIDAENHPSQVRESYADLVGLAARHGLEMQPGMLHLLEEWDAKHDLTAVSGKAWLEERFYAYRPELVLVGPLTNVVGKDLKYYEPVDMLRDTIDASRRICNSAIIMEHHAPKRGNGDKVREVTAYGSGLFLKWPDFGFAMVPSDHPDHVGTYVWEPMRGPRVRGRAWPLALRTGKPNTDEFPWEETERPPSVPKGR